MPSKLDNTNLFAFRHKETSSFILSTVYSKIEVKSSTRPSSAVCKTLLISLILNKREKLDSVFKDHNPFHNLNTKFLQEKFYKEHFNLLVSITSFGKYNIL